MKGIVCRKDLLEIASRYTPLVGTKNGIKRLERSTRFGRCSELPDNLALDRLANEQCFAYLLKTQLGDKGSDLRNDLDQLLIRQPEQGFPNRRAADPETTGDLELRDRLARSKSALHDLRVQPPVDLMSGDAGEIPADGSRGFHETVEPSLVLCSDFNILIYNKIQHTETKHRNSTQLIDE